MGDLGEQPLTSEIYPLEWYRETPLGPLPEEWKTVQIEDIAEVKGGKRLPKGHKFSDQPTPYPYIRVVDFKNNSIDLSNLRFLHSEDRKAIQRYTISCKDLYISIAGTIGLVGLVPQKIDGANLTENAAKIVIKDEKRVDQRYLVYFLASHIGQTEISQRTTKTSQPKLALTRIKQIPVILPPLLEQQGIAHVLSTVQKAIKTTEQVIEASRELKRSLMNHLFTYGPTPVDEAEQVPLKETEVGLVPEHWEITEVGALGEIVTGKTPSTKMPEYYGPPYMFVSPGDIGSQKYVAFTEKHLTKEGMEVSRPLPPYTVLVVCIGATIGKTALTTGEQSATNQQINAVLTRAGISPHYLYYELTRRSSVLPSLAGRAAVPIVNKSNFARFKVALAPVSEQDKIAQILSAVDEKISVEENRKRSLKVLFKTLLHNLMTGKVRVNDFDLSVVEAMT